MFSRSMSISLLIVLSWNFDFFIWGEPLGALGEALRSISQGLGAGRIIKLWFLELE
jgi:hypothetical protein